MHNPFRTDAKQQLIREAQIGLTAVAIVLAIFLYVAFYKITGRGRHITDRVGSAPIAEPAWPSANFGDHPASSSKTGLDVGSERLAMKSFHSRSTTSDRLIAGPQSTKNPNSFSSNRLDPFKPLAPSSKNQVTEFSGSQEQQTPPDKAKLASRIGDYASSKPGRFGTRELAASKSVNPNSDRSDDAGPIASSAATSRPPSQSRATELIAAKTFSKSDTKPNSFEPGSLETNDLRAANASIPQIDALNANRGGKKHDVQLTSAESNEIESAPENNFKPNQDKIVKDDFPTALHPKLPEPSVKLSGSGQSPATDSRSGSSDDSSLNDFKPAVENNDSLPNDLPTSSAKSHGTSVLVKPDNSWPGDSHKRLPQSHAKFDWPKSELPTLRSPRPLPNVVAEQPKPLAGSIQEDIAKVIAPDGSRTSIETGSQPTKMSANSIPPRPTTHLVREGDSYWSISAELYNDGRFFRALYQHNRFVTPSFELVPGTKLATPLKSDLIKLWPDHCPCEGSGLTGEVDGASPDANDRIYVTQRGDTLFEIAGQKLGQASRYLEIYRLNQARLETKVNHLSPLPAGVRLVLPPQ